MPPKRNPTLHNPIRASRASIPAPRQRRWPHRRAPTPGHGLVRVVRKPAADSRLLAAPRGSASAAGATATAPAPASRQRRRQHPASSRPAAAAPSAPRTGCAAAGSDTPSGAFRGASPAPMPCHLWHTVPWPRGVCSSEDGLEGLGLRGEGCRGVGKRGRADEHCCHEAGHASLCLWFVCLRFM